MQPTPPLTANRWQRIEAIFHAALETPDLERANFLSSACAGDAGLLAELQTLVAASGDEKRFHPPAVSVPKGRLGETLGGYKLDSELGQGGMGTVYLAHRVDGEFEQQVALKVVSPHLRTQFFTARFREERQILAKLNHPNITRILDGGVSSTGDPYLVMEYVDGQPIHQYCDQRLLSVDDRIRVFLQTCSSVEYAHHNLVVHHDLKPGNLLVTKEGVTKLLDFGTAKLLLTGEAALTSTSFGALTLRYASPEQMRGEPVSTSMDVYSLGVMLYELVVGAWPFGDPTSPIAGLERAVRDVDPAPPASLVTDEAARLRSTSRTKLMRVLDGDLHSVIAKAIEADARRRYSSVEQLSSDLLRYLAGQPVLAREQTLLYRTARFVGRHRWRLAAAAVVIAGLSALALVTVEQYGREQRRLVQVRDLSQSYLTDILNEVGKLPGSMKARLLIVDRARKNLDQLLPEAPRDPELRRALAVAYLQLADIQGRPFSVSVGDTAGALESYRKAETIAAQGDKRDWELLTVLVRARRVVATMDARSGRYAEALALLNATLDPARRLWQEAPADLQVEGKPAAALYVETNLTLGLTMLNAASKTNSLTEAQQALARFRRTIAIAGQVQAAHPNMPDVIGLCNQYAGFALEGLGERAGDIQYFKESAAAQHRASDGACAVFQKDPKPQTQRNCADALGEYSWAAHRALEGEQAVQAALQAVALMKPVSEAEPNSAEAQQDLATAYFHLGAAEKTAGRLQDAVVHLRVAESGIATPRQLPANDPLETGKVYINIERMLASTLLALHNPPAAIDALEKAISVAEKRATTGGWMVAELRHELEQARAAQLSSRR